MKSTPAIKSLRALARLNLLRCRQAIAAGNPRLAAWRYAEALSLRADANLLATTAR